ncbi:hypothetical protein GOD94_06100 [Sinorhizobium medicae]|nr:hypothetical protein [Sinorhizobium medicae]MDX0872473.1 hypothetical protein [Sinorhizobium medicae]
MDYLMVIENATGNGQMMALPDAATCTHIDAADIESSIGRFGVCSSIDYTIVDTEAAEDIVAA